MIIKKVIFDKADRLYQMPLDILSLAPGSESRLLKRADLIDLASLKWPVQFTSDFALEPTGLNATTAERINGLKEELAAWFAKHHQVKLNTTKEILIGGNVSTLAFSLALATIDNGDLAFVPDLAVPLYRQVIIACGGEPVGYGVSSKNNWQPDFDRINTRLGRVARVLFLNSPHNPTGAELTEKDLTTLIWHAGRENILVVNDAAYQSVPSRLPLSLLRVEGAKRVGVELYSFSYQFGLPALPFGFAVGNRDTISAMAQAAKLVRAPIPDYYVELALRAIRQYPNESLKTARTSFAQTLAEATNLFALVGLEPSGAATVPFAWVQIPRRRLSTSAVRLLYRRTHVLIAPGTSFGENGQGFLRFSLTPGPQAYVEAAARIKRRIAVLKGKADE